MRYYKIKNSNNDMLFKCTCGARLYYLTKNHCEKIHGMTREEFLKQNPEFSKRVVPTTPRNIVNSIIPPMYRCSKSNCYERKYKNGLCKLHYEENK